MSERLPDAEPAHEVYEAIRFAEEYGYSKWIVAQDALNGIVDENRRLRAAYRRLTNRLKLATPQSLYQATEDEA